MKIRTVVPMIGLAALIALSQSVGSVSAAPPASNLGSSVAVLTSLDMYAPALGAISHTAPVAQEPETIFVPTGNTPRTPQVPALKTVIIVGYSPTALPWVMTLARDMAPQATIEAISIPADSSNAAKVDAVGRALHAVGIPVSRYVSLSQ